MSNENQATKKRFQWIKGDRFGDVVDVEREDNIAYYFTDGTKIFKNVVQEFLEPVKGKSLPLPNAKTVTENIDKKIERKEDPKPIPPPPAVAPTVTTGQSNSQVKEEPKGELFGLISKLSKKNMVDFQPTLNLNIPKPTVFEMLIENTEEEPEKLIEAIAEVASSQIEINKLQQYLKTEITNFLNQYYNG